MYKFSEFYYSVYFAGIFATTVASFILVPEITVHGRRSSGISKRWYLVHYLLAVLFLLPYSSLFIIHPLRRLVESVVYSWNSRSRFTFLQFAHALIYFAILSLYLHDKHIKALPFIAANILQAIAHYRVYRLGKREFSHYYTEILLYASVLYSVPTVPMLLHELYILAFVYVSRANRAWDKSK